MDLGLENQKVLITGSTAGIGFATALAFAREKARVIVNGRTAERVRLAQVAIQDAVPEADVGGVAADVASMDGIARITEAHPDVDVLVNNAAVFSLATFEAIPDLEWLRFFETNVMSGIRLSRHYFPRMLQKGYGRIIFVSSESGVQIPPEMIHYGVTKTAQLAVARGLAERTRGTSVTVNSVLPGPTDSEAVGNLLRQVAKAQGTSLEAVERTFFESSRPTSLLGRLSSTQEIANMITYLGSRAASSTNGAAVRVDGGIVRSIV